MTSLISTIPCLSGPFVYSFWAISVQSYFAMITIPGSPYNAKDMLTSSTIPSTTNQDEHARCSSLDSQALGIMNSSLAHNILMHRKENAESLWNYLCNKYGSSGPASVFADYQHTRYFPISGNSDPAPQIAELDTLYTRLEGNKCNVPSLLEEESPGQAAAAPSGAAAAAATRGFLPAAKEKAWSRKAWW